MERDLCTLLCAKFGIESLTTEQACVLQTLSSASESCDVFVSSRTGSGKSLMYQGLPLIWKQQDTCASVLVIVPLRAIAEEACLKLRSLNFTAARLGAEKVTPSTDFVFTDAETVLQEKFKKMLKDDMMIGLIVVDEAHVTEHWGVAKDREDAFRGQFSKLGQLRSLCPGTPMLALTATASAKLRRKVKGHLNIDKCLEIVQSPDRPNIQMNVMKFKTSDDMRTIFGWLVELGRKGSACPRYLVFCQSKRQCGELYAYFVSKLEDSSIVDIYHAKTTRKSSSRIREDMANENGRCRILFCTDSAGMGVNFAGVNSAIHFHCPRNLDVLIQQVGRIGRSQGSQGQHLLLYSGSDLPHVEAEVLDYLKTEDCRRKSLAAAYEADFEKLQNLHWCCDNCFQSCECTDENPCVGYQHPACIVRDDEDTPFFVVSDEQKNELGEELRRVYRSQVPGREEVLEAKFCPTMDTLNAIVKNVDRIGSRRALIDQFPIWRQSDADIIARIVEDICGVKLDDESEDEAFELELDDAELANLVL